jgi:N-acetylglucosaminyl-diphospho-decaprenol L-rhamnosyltransferase
MLAHEFPGIPLLSKGENLGYARSVNLAFRKLPGPFYLILNGDCRIRAENAARLVDVYSQLESPGVLGPRQLDESGRLWVTWGGFPTPWRDWKRRRLNLKLAKAPPDPDFTDETTDPAPPVETDWVSGSCWLVHGDVVKKAGFIDEGYFLYFEDIDWCRQVREAGFRVYCLPGITAIHASGSSAASEPFAADLAYRRSQLRFAAKHWSGLEQSLLRAYLTLKFARKAWSGSEPQRNHARQVLAIIRESWRKTGK